MEDSKVDDIASLFQKAMTIVDVKNKLLPKEKHWAVLIEGAYFFECPYCGGGVQVLKNQVACKIFRHGSYKQPNNPPIPPHLPKDQCDELVRDNKVNGCAKPFLFVFNTEGNYVEKCGYI